MDYPNNDYIENIVGTFAVLAEFIPLNISVMQIYIHVAGMGTNFVQWKVLAIMAELFLCKYQVAITLSLYVYLFVQ